MEIQITALCKTKDSSFLTLEQEYLKRFSSSWKVGVRELGGEKFLKHSPSEQCRYHSELLQKSLDPSQALILLDEGGKEHTTQGFQQLLRIVSREGAQRMVFAIGGPQGWSDELKRSVQHSLSLSKMTMPYQLARVVLIEQLYRVYALQNHIPYHR